MVDCQIVNERMPTGWSTSAAHVVKSFGQLSGGLHTTLPKNLVKVMRDLTQTNLLPGEDPLMAPRPRALRPLTVHVTDEARAQLERVTRDARHINFLTPRTKVRDFQRAVCMLALYAMEERNTTQQTPLVPLYITVGYALLRLLAQLPGDPVDDESMPASDC